MHIDVYMPVSVQVLKFLKLVCYHNANMFINTLIFQRIEMRKERFCLSTLGIIFTFTVHIIFLSIFDFDVVPFFLKQSYSLFLQ